MRLFKLKIVAIVFFISMLGYSQNSATIQDEDYNNTLFKQEDLDKLLQESYYNEKLMLERLTAFFFHNLINEYRLKGDGNWLFWDENLWLAARNQNVYLFELNYISHNQDKGNNYFTGVSPSDRIDYVSKTDYNARGENIHYSSSSYSRQNDIVERAKGIAKDSFESWKHSPGHNRNMLEHKYNSHGTSFLINDNKVLATSVFQGSNSIQVEEIAITWDDEIAKGNVPLFIVKDQEVYSSIPEKDLNKKVLEIIKKKFVSTICINDNNLNQAAKRHVDYLIANNTLSSIQNKGNKKFYARTPKKRYVKAAGNFKWLTCMFTKVYDKSIILQYPLKDFIDSEQVFADIDKKMQRFLPNTSIIEKWGVDVNFYKEQNDYYCVINIVYIVR